MSSSIYQAWSVTVGEQPTTAYWNILGSNDASFNSGVGLNDDTIGFRHLQPDTIPTGIIQPYAGATLPSINWLFCDGSAVSRSAYSALFAVCGTSYGAGDGTTTFNLPNTLGRVPVGVGSGDANFSALGQMGGEDSHVLSVNEMPVHSHGVYDPGHNHGIELEYGSSLGLNSQPPGNYNQVTFRGYGKIYGAMTNDGTGIGIYNSGSSWGHNNLQPYVTINYIIKT